MIPPRVQVEAAAWLARLKSESLNAQDRGACEAWLARSEAHRQALAEATAAWDAAGVLRELRAAPAPSPALGVGRGPARLQASRRELVLGGLACAGGAGLWAVQAPRTYATGIGEVRRVRLEDGSIAILDTDSRIRVRMRRDARHVQLDRGRVALSVRSDARRPFTVASPGLQVLAMGRALEVSQRSDRASVVALDGRLLVKTARRAVQLGAGERLVEIASAPAATDRPMLERETAWQSGRLVFDDDPLGAAAAEINRYNLRPVVVAPELAGLRVSGVYAARDADGFASAIATLFGLEVVQAADGLRLERQRLPTA